MSKHVNEQLYFKKKNPGQYVVYRNVSVGGIWTDKEIGEICKQDDRSWTIENLNGKVLSSGVTFKDAKLEAVNVFNTKKKIHRPLLMITLDLENTAKEIKDLVETFSALRFELYDRSEELKDKTALKYYEGWTREMHLHLGNAMEVMYDISEDNIVSDDEEWE